MMLNLVLKSFFFIAISASLMFLQGCSKSLTKTIDPMNIAEINNAENILTISLKTGKLTLLTPLGITPADLTLGLPDEWSVGERLIYKYNIKNPNETLKLKFIEHFNKTRIRSRFIDIEKSQTPVESSIENLKAKYVSGYALKFSPVKWEIQYIAHNKSHFTMLFEAKAELIRIDDKKIIWSSVCKTQEDEDNDQGATLAQLIADDSQILSQWIEKATDYCSEQYIYYFPKIMPKILDDNEDL